MKYKAKEDFLWYKMGQDVPECEHSKMWLDKGHIEAIAEEEPKVTVEDKQDKKPVESKGSKRSRSKK